MHYPYFDFRHTLSDSDREGLLHDAYEHLLPRAAEGAGRSVNRVLKYLRESDFYSVPCRHHPFPGGNAWHQLETLHYAYHMPAALPQAQGFDLPSLYRQWQPQWLQLSPLSLALTALLHDLCNSRHPKLRYPDRILRRHGRKSTYILKDFLRFELMFDENMAIIHHQHKTPADLRAKTPTEQDYQLIADMPLYHMIQCCDTLSCLSPLTESDLTAAVAVLISEF